MLLAVRTGMQQTHRKAYIRWIRHRRARRGFSLFELIITIAIIAMLSASVTVAIIKVKNHADISTATTNAQTLRSAVKVWWADHDSASCPTVAMLLADGAIEKGKFTKNDMWDQPWQIKCEDSDATIISRGPDKLPDTEDDIRVPKG